MLFSCLSTGTLSVATEQSVAPVCSAGWLELEKDENVYVTIILTSTKPVPTPHQDRSLPSQTMIYSVTTFVASLGRTALVPRLGKETGICLILKQIFVFQ